MTTFHVLSGLIVVLAGFFCVGLALIIVLQRATAQRFLGQFAASARAHFTEQTIRFVAGVAIVFYTPYMAWSDAFEIFGWILIITSVALMLSPWRAHRRFAEWSMPWVFRYIYLYAGGAFVLGVIILYAAFSGRADVQSLKLE